MAPSASSPEAWLVVMSKSSLVVHGPGQESSYNVGVDDFRELIALPREAPDVLMKSFPELLSVVF